MSWCTYDDVYQESVRDYEPELDYDRPSRAELLEDELEYREAARRRHEAQRQAAVDGYAMLPDARRLPEPRPTAAELLADLEQADPVIVQADQLDLF